MPITRRKAGSLPHPALPAGKDTISEIDNVVILMLENRSFDHLLGAMGRGDGLTMQGKTLELAENSNPDGKGHRIKAFHLPTDCRLEAVPSQSWNQTHHAYDSGKMDGFITNGSGPSAMGFYTSENVPFLWSLASTFPINDRFFASVMGPTFPNRRYLIAGTSNGLITDSLTGMIPPNGTIFDTLDKYSISWKNYYTDFSTLMLYSTPATKSASARFHINQFYADAARGTLPAVSLVNPQFGLFGAAGDTSEGEGQDIQYGDDFLGRVVNALMDGPKWAKTIFLLTYDEPGGYYDHVPPPAAVPPDSVAPQLAPGDVRDGFDRFGLRVPMVLASPYAKSGYVSHAVADFTSFLAFIEAKWNLPALTDRDANAHNLLDMLNFANPAFATPPALAKPPPVPANHCATNSEGSLPPPDAVVAA